VQLNYGLNSESKPILPPSRHRLDCADVIETLPLPEKKKSLKPIQFSVEAGLVHRLGAESVSDQVLSVVELVKNSYDDDAENVVVILENLRTGASSITVTDDGNGMTREQLVNGWMRIATTHKLRQPISPVYKRHRLGQKGVGRFAVENLSTYTVITSYPRGSKEGYEIVFEWNKYRKYDADLSKIPNNFYKFSKDPKVHGLRIKLLNLNHNWLEADVRRLLLFLKALTPPAISAAKFQITVDTEEFEQLKGVVDSDFLNRAIFVFDTNLAKTGEMKYRLFVPSKKTTLEKTAKLADFSCGPIHFKLYFYYREKSKLAAHGIIIPSIDDLRKILDDYGGIKIYRDRIRLSGFGNPDDDWVGLDAMSRNDPSVVPSRNQIIGTVKITSQENPEITETTTRENLIRNRSFQDMLKFIRNSIGVFAQMRGEIEQKRQAAPKQGKAYITKAVDRIQENKERKELLDFADKYPLVFYKKLEEEINHCYTSALPNAALVLSRKLVENLLYQILEYKFPKELDLRYIVAQGRAQDFSVLINNMETRIADFDREQQDLIQKLLQRIKTFKRDANSTAHKVMEYLDTPDELGKLKVPEIVEIQLQLINKVKQ